jgi:hypothetical protein
MDSDRDGSVLPREREWVTENIWAQEMISNKKMDKIVQCGNG